MSCKIQTPPRLAFTQYCHYQHCMACIAMEDGRVETLYRAIVCATKCGGGAHTRGVFADNSMDSCTKASN